MLKPLNILHLEDRPETVGKVKRLLADHGIASTIVESRDAQDFLQKIEGAVFAAIIAGYPFSGFGHDSALYLAQLQLPATPFIIFDAKVSADEAIELLTTGATDVLIGARESELPRVLSEAVAKSEQKTSVQTAQSILATNEQRFRQLCEVVTEAVVVHEQGIILNANHATARIFGYDLGEIIGANILNFVQQRNWPRLQELFDVVNPFPFEMTGVRKDGSTLPLDVLSKIIRHVDTTTRIVIMRDMTERKRTEKGMRESELKSRLIGDTAPSGLIIYNGRRVLYSNRAMEEMTGYTRDELLGINFFQLVHSDSLEAIKSTSIPRPAPDSEVIEDALRREIRIIRKDGQERWLDFAARWIDSEEMTGVLGAAFDISERKPSQGNDHEHPAILDIIQDAILVADTNGVVQYCNKAALKLFSWNEGSVGKPLRDLLSSNEPQKLQEAWNRTLAEGSWLGELDILTLDSRKIAFGCRWSAIQDGGLAKAILMVGSDAAEKKHFEAQVLRSQRMESISTLAGGISHDLNNILTPCLMAVHLLRKKMRDEGSLKYLNTLDNSLQRGAAMVKQVLTFARGSEGQRSVVQIASILKEMGRVAHEGFPENVHLEISSSASVWPLSADAVQLNQAVLNLCLNARDAMSKGGKILLSAENVLLDDRASRLNPDAHAGPYVLVKVRDAGTGIPPHLLDRIFEPFFTTKEYGKGSGLGLSTVLGIVKSHKGFVTVHSEVGNGSEFRLYLPALSDASEGPVKAAAAAAIEDSKLPVGNGECVLVADDEAAVRDVTQNILEAYGYNVLTAGDGTEALAVFAKDGNKIDVVLLDMLMPYLDGMATIRALDRFSGRLKIITMSGLSTHQAEAQKASTCVKAFLHKPYSAEKLLRTLKEVLALKSQ